MLYLVEIALVVMSGLFALILTWATVGNLFRGEYYLAACILVFAIWMGYVCWSALSRMRAAKQKSMQEFRELVSKLESMSYERAVQEARGLSVSFPCELALRKISPTSAEWVAFERKTLQFVVEKVEPEGRVRVTLIP